MDNNFVDWKLASYWEDDKWSNAYKLFLSNSPLIILNNELKYHATEDLSNDHGFTIRTIFPELGFYEDIDKRAILLVISRSRNMEYCNWNNISNNINIVDDLSIIEKLVVNSIISQIEFIKK